MLKKFTLGSFLLLWISITSAAPSTFQIKKIDIQGLQGITRETVLSYLPVKEGNQFSPSQANNIIQSLYKTGFFEKVNLLQDGHTLIIQVVQRPIVNKIVITGNKEIPTDKLLETLKGLGFAEGEIFNRALLEKIKVSLAREYVSVGKYNTTIDTTTSPQDRNRVSVTIAIAEGKTAKIKQIHIIGNQSFGEKELLKQFALSTPHFWSFFNNDDQYSREKLEGDLEALRSYYMDRGYIRFNIDSSQVSISPDKSQVYITIKITEGAPYYLTGYEFKGTNLLTPKELDDLAQLKKGTIFSRKTIMDANRRIATKLGDIGYANTNINMQPKIDDKAKTVFITLVIYPGKRMYIHRISFSQNYRTNDRTLRREMVQQEGALFSSSKIEESKRGLLLLPYIRNVEVSSTPVPGKPDEVDMNYKVEEQSPAELRAGLGYSQLEKLMVHGGITHNNVLGTGNSLRMDVMYSKPATSINFSYYNPYYTQSGIGRSFNLYTTRFDASAANITSYATNEYGASVGYNFRISRDDSLQAGFGYENVYLSVGSSPSNELKKFTQEHGEHFYQLKLTGGWTHQGFDRSIFPTRGLMQSLSVSASAPISKNSLEYYKTDYGITYYHPIYKGTIGQLRGSVSYGNGYGKYKELPFFKNFYAGGMGSVRGYAGNTLGPKDSNGNALGGNFELDGTAGLVFPNPFGDNLRTVWFVDAGNAYQGIHFNNIRYSTGIEFDWLSPIGLLNFSISMPIKAKPGDDKEPFQFNIGTSF